MPVVKKHSAQRQSQAIPHCTHFAAAILAQKPRGYSHVSVRACVHVVCVCMPLWVLHNINEADLCVAVLPEALAYTLTCINANGVMHLMQMREINNALHPFISYLPAPDAEQGHCKASLYHRT